MWFLKIVLRAPKRGVSGTLQIYRVIKTSRLRQLTGSIKTEPKYGSWRENTLMSE